ncbi:hypothetical protein DIPPA_14654 [Diplonema papillatum]|nr:hypothetical protein DIPPA_14654 [Diplonema papillatum]
MTALYNRFFRWFDEQSGDSGCERRRTKIWLLQHAWTLVLCSCSLPLMATESPANVAMALAIVESAVGMGVARDGDEDSRSSAPFGPLFFCCF